MSFMSNRTIRSSFGIGAIVLLAGFGLTACDDDSSPSEGFNQTIKGEDGSESTVRFGDDAEIPEDFPDVPLPNAGNLRSVVAEKNPPNASYTMTYRISAKDGITIGNRYRERLEDAGYEIEHFSSVGGSDGGITQFDAIGKKWDVAVVSGKASPRDRPALSVQVHTHGQITSGIGGIGDTTPEATAPKGSGVEVPSTDPEVSTTTTTLGF